VFIANHGTLRPRIAINCENTGSVYRNRALNRERRVPDIRDGEVHNWREQSDTGVVGLPKAKAVKAVCMLFQHTIFSADQAGRAINELVHA
jgi:hypothetical protein